uniref:Cmp-n-acetylneuraminate-poly-alpha-8-sialyltran sferase n=1 Tax=Tetraselmis sp. GSL018 TaxID=582737 RepID=A0A061RGY4_9CHLO
MRWRFQSFIFALVCVSALRHVWYARNGFDFSEEFEEEHDQAPVNHTEGSRTSIRLKLMGRPVRLQLGAVLKSVAARRANGPLAGAPEPYGGRREELGGAGDVAAELGTQEGGEEPAGEERGAPKHTRGHSRGRQRQRAPPPPDVPFFVSSSGKPGGVGAPTFDNWTLYLLDTTPLLLHQTQFDSPGCRRGGDLNSNGFPHSGMLRYIANSEGLLEPWSASADPRARAAETKFLYSSSIISKLPHRDQNFSFGTCAIVSNSGNLLEAHYGLEIDKHDAVFRINNAPTVGYERHVGSKTTFDLLNRPHADEVSHMRISLLEDEVPDVAAVLFEADNWHLYHHILERQLHHMPYPGTLVLAPTFLDRVNALWMRLAKRWPRFANSCADIKRAAVQGESSMRCQKMLRDCSNEVCKPSSGFFALVFAAQMCNQIDMYGFESYRKSYPYGAKRRRSRYHYFDEEEGTTTVHSFVLIMKVFEFLSHRYPITIKTPKYNAEEERLLEIEERLKARKPAKSKAEMLASKYPEIQPFKPVETREANRKDSKQVLHQQNQKSKGQSWIRSHLPIKHQQEVLSHALGSVLIP